MEAVPRLPMISFPPKLAMECEEFAVKIKRYIRDHYNEDPDSYSNEILEFEGLRRSAISPPTDFTGCATLKRYYCQLHNLSSRFPLTEGGIDLSFTWVSAFSDNHITSGDVNCEMQNILYNIAILHMELGAVDSRTTSEGMKISCTHFQCSAWAFQNLNQNLQNDAEFNPLQMNFMLNICLSQAQECILEKSLTDNRKPNIIVKVSMQVVEYLRLSVKHLDSFKKSGSIYVDQIGSKLLKQWQRHMDFKIAYYQAVTLFHQGLHSEEQQKMGERISFYQGSAEKLEEALKLSKNMENAKQIAETMTFSNDVIQGKLTAAQKENEFVYHEKVPPLDSLPTVKGASLVKGIPFSHSDPEVAGQDIFARLVPIEAHQESSKYSEEKAKLLRHIASQIQEKNDELKTYLASMQLDSLVVDDSLDTVPQELVDCCADLNSRDAIKELTESMADINDSYHEIGSKIAEISSLIKNEEEKEKEFKIMIGGKGPPNQIITDLRRENEKYKEAHKATQDKNLALDKAVLQHSDNIKVLSLPLDKLLASLPSVASVEGEGDKAIRQEVQRLMRKINEMQTQRTEFETKLRNNLQEDDITKLLVTNKGDMDEFFKGELQKHSSIVSLLEQNMSAQNNILQALSEANAAYATTRRLVNQVKSQRTEFVNGLLASYNASIGITDKANDAKKFYSHLSTQIAKISSRLKSVCKVEEEQREEKLSANVRKFTGENFPSYKRLDKKVPQSDFSASSGPKLKDFLQADRSFLGAKGFGAAGQPNVDYNSALAYSLPSVTYGSQVGTTLSSASIPPQTHIYSQPTTTISANNYSGYPNYANTVATNYPPSAINTSSASTFASSYPQTYNHNTMLNYAATPKVSSNATVTSTIPTIPTASSSTNYPSIYGSQPASKNIAPTQPYYPGTPSVASSNAFSPYVATQGQKANSIQSTQQFVPQNSNFYSVQQPQPQPRQPIPQAGGYMTGSNAHSLYQQPGAPQPTLQHPQQITSSSQYPGVQQPDSKPSNVLQAAQLPISSTQPHGGTYQPYSQVPANQHITPQVPRGQHSTPHPSPSQTATFYQPSSQIPGLPQSLSTQPTLHQNSSLLQGMQQPSQVDGLRLPSQVIRPQGQNLHTYSQPNPHVQGAHTNQFSSANSMSSHSQSQKPYYAQTTTAAPHSGFNHLATPYANTYPQVTPHQPYMTDHQKLPYQSANAIPYSAPMTQSSHSYGTYTQANGIYSLNSLHQVSSTVSQHPSPTANSISLSSCTPSSLPYSDSIPNSYAYTNVMNSPTSVISASGNQPQLYSGVSPNYSSALNPNQTYQSQATAAPTQVSSSTPSQVAPAPAKVEANQASNASINKTSGISNLDLLSDIDLASPSPQWCPLLPQPLTSTTSADSCDKGPDVTANILHSSESKNCEPEKDLPNIVPNVSMQPFTSDAPTMQASIDAAINLATLAKQPKRSTSFVDPLTNDETLNALALETERFSKYVQGLDKKSLNGPTNLEIKWKELSDMMEQKFSSLKVSVGRCYPLKNRFADILPFDETRVQLPSPRDDYINASYVQLKSTDEGIPMIMTQAPLPTTFADFWLMVWENQVETIVCLNTEAEVKGQVYFPQEMNDSQEFGGISIILKQICNASNDSWVRRTFHMTHASSKISKVVIHMQFLNWPPSAMPESPGQLLQFICEVHSLQKQQRNKLHPMAVHCVPGTGRSGIFGVLSSFIKFVHSTGTLADVWNLVVELCQQRRGGIHDRTYLHFLYSAALYYAQEILMKRGILTDKATFEEGPREKTHVRHPSADLLSSDLNRIKANLGFDSESSTSPDPGRLNRTGSQSSIMSNGSTKSGSCSRPNLEGSSAPSRNETPSPSHGGSSATSLSPAHSLPSGGDSNKHIKIGSTSLPPNLAASLDPDKLKLEMPNPPKPKKITKESFLIASGGTLTHSEDDQQDPLSGLDPLWNLKKS